MTWSTHQDFLQLLLPEEILFHRKQSAGGEGRRKLFEAHNFILDSRLIVREAMDGDSLGHFAQLELPIFISVEDVQLVMRKGSHIARR